MNKKIKVTILSAMLALCTLSAGGLAGVGLAGASAEVVWSEVTTVETSYALGDKLTIPTRKLTVNGTEYDAAAKLTRPDGTATSAASVTLDQAGRYALQYSAVVNGVPYEETLSFIVQNGAYLYGNSDTAVTYGKGVYANSPETEGLYVKLQEQDSVEFQQIITIPQTNEDISLLKYFIAPTELESANFSKIIFTLTDVTDSSNYLQIVAQSSRPDTGDGRGGCYLLAGGNGQQLKGDQGGNIHVNNNYGARSNSGSFFGYKVAGWTATDGFVLESVDPSTLAIELKFNPVTCEVKADNTVIIDTDSNAHYGGASDVKWTGFESGYVKLSVKCDGYNTSSADFVLTSLRDTDLSSRYSEDTLPPEITVETEYDLNDMPVARVGENEYYTVPAAKAYDLTSGNCEVQVAVYKNYGSESQARVNVENGKFKTDASGTYAIVYTACDVYGNYAAPEVLYVQAADNVPEMTFDTSEKTTSCEAGNKVIIPAPSVSGGSGNKTVTARVCLDEAEFTFDSSMKEWAFYPEEAGTWTVEYSATDYTEHTETESYTIEVTAASAPIFRDALAMPKILVAGLGNKLPELTAYDYTTGTLTTAIADVEVKDKNGIKTYKAGDVFVPEVAANGDQVEITYKYDNGKSSVTQGPFSIPAIFGYENDSLTVGNYFYSVGEAAFEKTVTDNGVKIISAAGDHAWVFANTLVANGFNLTFGRIKDRCTYQKIVVTLSDLQNPEQVLVVTFTGDSDKPTMSSGSVSDTVDTVSVEGKDGSEIQNITIELVNNRLLVNGYAYDPDKNADGSKFVGFSSGKLNLRFDVIGAGENSGYYVCTVTYFYGYFILSIRLDFQFYSSKLA